MSLGDWDFLTSTATYAFGLDITNPIVGAGSVHIGGSPGASSTAKSGTLILDPLSFTVGMTKGRIRTLYRCDFATDAGETLHYIAVGGGISFMHSAANINTTNSNFYSVQVIQGYTNQDTAKVIVGKATANTLGFYGIGWDGSTATGDVLTDTDSSFTFEQGDVIPIQVEWNYDLAELGGIRITVQKGNVGDVNYSNLATIYDLVDTSSPFSTSMGEGLAMTGRVTSATFQLSATEWGTFDQTGVFQLV